MSKEITSEELIKEALTPLISKIKKVCFVDGYEATDQEAMGLIVSKFTEWDSQKILEIASYALEDANDGDSKDVIDELISK